MQVQHPIETEQRTSWRSKLEAMELDAELVTAFKASPTVRHAIWTIQNLTDYKYQTRKDGAAIIVKRVA